MDEVNPNKKSSYPIVGRNSHIDLSKYSIRVHGRDIIDYEKLKANEPELYQEILKNEHEENRQSDIQIDEMLDR